MTKTAKEIAITIACLLAFLFALLEIRNVVVQWQKATQSDETRLIRECKEHKARMFQGVVISIHNCIMLSDSSQLCLRRWCPNQSWAINIGDSIYKPANTFDMYIFRRANPDSVIFIRCSFCCRSNRAIRTE